MSYSGLNVGLLFEVSAVQILLKNSIYAVGYIYVKTDSRKNVPLLCEVFVIQRDANIDASIKKASRVDETF